MVVKFFEVVVDGCRWLQEVLGGCRSFLLLVTTNYAHQRAFTYNTTISKGNHTVSSSIWN